MLDVEIYLHSIKATWIKRLFQYEQPNSSWNILVLHLNEMCCNPQILLNMRFLKTSESPKISQIPIFYAQVLLAYNHSKIEIDI